MIHHTAIIDKNSKISEDVEIGPYCVIGSEVEIAIQASTKIQEININLRVISYPSMELFETQNEKYRAQVPVSIEWNNMVDQTKKERKETKEKRAKKDAGGDGDADGRGESEIERAAEGGDEKGADAVWDTHRLRKH